MARTFGQFADSLARVVKPGAVPMPKTPVAAATAAPAAPEQVEQPAPEAASSRHPVYDSQDDEDPDSGHARLMEELGKSLQEMMEKDPETNKSMTDLIEEFMGKGVDFESEGKRLRGLIASRQTPQAPNWLAAGVGSWAGGPAVAQKFESLREAATGAEKQKQQDLEDLEGNLVKEHVADLRARGKTKEALMMGLLSGVMAERKTEKQANLRRELQDRALGAAEERVRLQINNRNDIADKDRTAAQVIHLYETLLRQTTKDVTGAVTPLYSADQAMKIAVESILPKVKAGVEAVKTGEAPVQPEGETPAESQATTPKATSKYAAWKAAQAAARKTQ